MWSPGFGQQTVLGEHVEDPIDGLCLAETGQNGTGLRLRRVLWPISYTRQTHEHLLDQPGVLLSQGLATRW